MQIHVLKLEVSKQRYMCAQRIPSQTLKKWKIFWDTGEDNNLVVWGGVFLDKFSKAGYSKPKSPSASKQFIILSKNVLFQTKINLQIVNIA